MNLSSLVAASAARVPDHTAIIVGRRACTYAQLEAATARTAAALQAAGVAPGRKIALAAPNGPEFVAAMLGIFRHGAIAVPCPADMQAPERAAMLDMVRCEYDLSLSPSGGSVAAGQLPQSSNNELSRSSIAAASFCPLADEGARTLHLVPTACLASDPVDERLAAVEASSIRFTSGTTASFKGVVLSHRGIHDRIVAANQSLRIGGDDVIFFALPMAHHFAVSVMLHLSVGATIVTGSLFLGDSMIRQVREHRATMLYSTPVTYRVMAEAPRVDPAAFRSVRLAISTAMALPPAVAARFEERSRVPLLQALGIIEVGMPIMNLPRPDRAHHALGRLIDSFEARVVDDDGRDVPAGQAGELWLKGPGMLAAYYAPWRTQEQILHEGWFRTGDTVRRDSAGNFFLMGRSKDVINVGGTKVFPIEIEEVLHAHDAVAEAAVVPVPNDLLGEVPAAAVELHPGSTTTPEALAEHCRRRLSTFKLPRIIRIVDRLPRTHSGKVARARLDLAGTPAPESRAEPG